MFAGAGPIVKIIEIPTPLSRSERAFNHAPISLASWATKPRRVKKATTPASPHKSPHPWSAFQQPLLDQRCQRSGHRRFRRFPQFGQFLGRRHPVARLQPAIHQHLPQRRGDLSANGSGRRPLGFLRGGIKDQSARLVCFGRPTDNTQREANEEPGSLKPRCPSEPSPRICRSMPPASRMAFS